MAGDVTQDPVALARIFRGLGLAGPDEEVLAEPLTGGVSSAIGRVRLRSGRYCVKQALPQLKVAKEWKVPVERFRYEVDWLRTAAPVAGGHVPRVLGVDEPTRSFVMEDLGAEHTSWKSRLLDGDVDPGVAGSLGDLLGRIHAATADRADVAARFATDASFHAIRLEPYLVESARVHPPVADSLHGLVQRTAATRRVLVHGDVSPKNVLVGPRAPVLLDAECAWFGDPAFDVAFCLNHFLLKAVHLPAHARALLLCFENFAAGYAVHVRWEPWEVLERRTATLLPGLALARVDGKSPVEYLGERARSQVRSASLALIALPVHTLAGLQRRWMELVTP